MAKKNDAEGYKRARTVDEAVSFLSKNKDARVIAGGTDLFPAIKVGKMARPKVLVDIWDIPALKKIRKEKKDKIVIGSLVTASDIIQSRTLEKNCNALYQAATLMAAPQIRNRATLGGNVGNASPAADLSTALVALGAIARLKGPRGVREVPIDKLFTGPGRTCLKHSELIVEFAIPVPTVSSFAKLRKRNAMTLAVASAAASVDLDKSGVITGARIALGAVGPKPLRARECEKYLEGKKLSEIVSTKRAMEDFGSIAECECSPIGDVRSSSDYRKKTVPVLCRMALEECAKSLGVKA